MSLKLLIKTRIYYKRFSIERGVLIANLRYFSHSVWFCFRTTCYMHRSWTRQSIVYTYLFISYFQLFFFMMNTIFLSSQGMELNALYQQDIDLGVNWPLFEPVKRSKDIDLPQKYDFQSQVSGWRIWKSVGLKLILQVEWENFIFITNGFGRDPVLNRQPGFGPLGWSYIPDLSLFPSVLVETLKSPFWILCGPNASRRRASF